jgi:hypothetical protein
VTLSKPYDRRNSGVSFLLYRKWNNMKIRTGSQEKTARTAVRNGPAVQYMLKHPRNRVYVIPCHKYVESQEAILTPSCSTVPANRRIHDVCHTSTMATALSFAPCGLHRSASYRSRWLKSGSGGA